MGQDGVKVIEFSVNDEIGFTYRPCSTKELASSEGYCLLWQSLSAYQNGPWQLQQ
jgi:hypothetical protein